MRQPTPFVLDDEETMEAGMDLMLRNELPTTVVGIDASGTRFLAALDDEHVLWAICSNTGTARLVGECLVFPVVCI